MRILALPRDQNPYQVSLYSEMQHLGVQVTYLGELTCSQTINLLLLPLELVVRRAAGARLIHLHWVFTFTFPGTRRLSLMRRAGQIWFLIWLKTCRILRMQLVWTAHNAVPHEPVFADDLSARRALVEASDLVVAHSQSALDELAAFGAVPRKSVIIRHGPITPVPPAGWLYNPGSDDGSRRFLFIGRVREYKGVEDLMTAFLAMPQDTAAHLTIAGQCDDPRLQSRLSHLASQDGTRITLRLERIPEDELARLLASADVVVLPFRRVTTSGSAMLALSHGRPLIVPELAGLADLPDEAVLRYDGRIQTLIVALMRLASADRETLAMMSAAAHSYAYETTWREIAEITVTEMISVLAGPIRAQGTRPASANPMR
jgi:glycosyltransferase involved in cell wall biosynthesis